MKAPLPSAAGEFLMLRLVSSEWSFSLEQRLRALVPGGVLLASPLPRSPKATYELLGEIARCLPTPPILALEPEGGEDPLSGLLPTLPPMRALAQKGARFLRQAGELLGETLRLVGFNTYFAPTLDLASECTDEIAGASTFNANPHTVAEFGGAFVEGLSRHKILACGKHFPGLAGVPTSVHGELPSSMRSMAELWRSDLVPYRELLPRLPMVLMSVAAYRAYDYDYPRSAVLSTQVVDGLLRRKLDYRGVVVAPQLESQSVRGALDLSRAAVESLYSGCDMLLVEKDESWRDMRRGIDGVFALGQLAHPRMEQSLQRIRAAKRSCSPPKGAFPIKAWERLARRVEEFSSHG